MLPLQTQKNEVIFVALANTSCFLLMTGAEFIPLDGGCHAGLSDSVRSV